MGRELICFELPEENSIYCTQWFMLTWHGAIQWEMSKKFFFKTLNCILQISLPLFLLMKYQTRTWCKVLQWMKMEQIGKHSCTNDCFSKGVRGTAHLCSPEVKVKSESAFLFCTSSWIFYILHHILFHLVMFSITWMEHCLLFYKFTQWQRE